MPLETEQKTSLEQLQKWMQEALLNPFEAQTQAIESIVKSSNKLDARSHLAIYQRSYVARLRACMAKQFEALQFALGKELFQQFADQYLQTYPSKSYTLIDLGKNFPRFLQETRPDRDAEVKESWPDFLIELTQFEYHLQVIFDELNTQKYVLASEETPESQLGLVPVFHLFEFHFPVHHYYSVFRNGQHPELPFPQHSWCAIYRVNYQITFQGLNYWQFQFLTHFQNAQNLKKSLLFISEQSGRAFSEVEKYWAEWRKNWVKAGILVDLQ